MYGKSNLMYRCMGNDVMIWKLLCNKYSFIHSSVHPSVSICLHLHQVPSCCVFNDTSSLPDDYGTLTYSEATDGDGCKMQAEGTFQTEVSGSTPKWLIFYWRHFHAHFLDWELLYFEWNFTEFFFCPVDIEWTLVKVMAWLSYFLDPWWSILKQHIIKWWGDV